MIHVFVECGIVRVIHIVLYIRSIILNCFLFRLISHFIKLEVCLFVLSFTKENINSFFLLSFSLSLLLSLFPSIRSFVFRKSTENQNRNATKRWTLPLLLVLLLLREKKMESNDSKRLNVETETNKSHKKREKKRLNKNVMRLQNVAKAIEWVKIFNGVFCMCMWLLVLATQTFELLAHSPHHRHSVEIGNWIRTH